MLGRAEEDLSAAENLSLFTCPITSFPNCFSLQPAWPSSALAGSEPLGQEGLGCGSLGGWEDLLREGRSKKTCLEGGWEQRGKGVEVGEGGSGEREEAGCEGVGGRQRREPGCEVSCQ